MEIYVVLNKSCGGRYVGSYSSYETALAQAKCLHDSCAARGLDVEYVVERDYLYTF